MYTDYPETFQATFPTATEASPQLASSLKFSQLDTTPDPTTWVRERGPVTFPSLPAGTIPSVHPIPPVCVRASRARMRAARARPVRARARKPAPLTGEPRGSLTAARPSGAAHTHARTRAQTQTHSSFHALRRCRELPPQIIQGRCIRSSSIRSYSIVQYPLYSIVQYSIDRPVFSGQYSAAVFDRPRAAVFDRPNEQARSLGPPPPATSEHRVGLGSSERAQQTDAGTVFDQRAFDPRRHALVSCTLPMSVRRSSRAAAVNKSSAPPPLPLKVISSAGGGLGRR